MKHPKYGTPEMKISADGLMGEDDIVVEVSDTCSKMSLLFLWDRCLIATKTLEQDGTRTHILRFSGRMLRLIPPVLFERNLPII